MRKKTVDDPAARGDDEAASTLGATASNDEASARSVGPPPASACNARQLVRLDAEALRERSVRLRTGSRRRACPLAPQPRSRQRPDCRRPPASPERRAFPPWARRAPPPSCRPLPRERRCRRRRHGLGRAGFQFRKASGEGGNVALCAVHVRPSGSSRRPSRFARPAPRRRSWRSPLPERRCACRDRRWRRSDAEPPRPRAAPGPRARQDAPRPLARDRPSAPRRNSRRPSQRGNNQAAKRAESERAQGSPARACPARRAKRRVGAWGFSRGLRLRLGARRGWRPPHR